MKRYKELKYFYAAALSLVFSGYLLRTNGDLTNLIVLITCCIMGVFSVYRLNDIIDLDPNHKLNLKEICQEKEHRIFLVLFILVVVPLAFIFLNNFQLLVLTLSAIWGILYSISFKVNGKIYRLKNILFVKNLAIGIAWGTLIFIGAGEIYYQYIILYFVLVTIEVFIGSTIRDFPDMSKDKQAGVKSIPLAIGCSNTFILLHFVNILSLILITGSYKMTIIVAPVVIWRAVNLFYLQKDIHNTFWNQKMNLFTCVLVLITTLLLINGIF